MKARLLQFSSFHFALITLFIASWSESNAQTFQKTFGGSFSSDKGFYTQQTSDRGFIITGYTKSYSVNGDYDAYLIKTDSLGDTIWTKTYGGPDQDGGSAVQQTTDGGYVIIGVADSISGGGEGNIFLIKTNNLGDTLWTRTFDAPPSGASTDIGRSVQQTTDGGFILEGYTDAFNVSASILLIKTDGNGDTLWTRDFYGCCGISGYTVRQTSDGGYIVGGMTAENGDDFLLLKLNSQGNLLWAKKYGGPGYEEGRSTDLTLDGGFIMAGWNFCCPLLLRFDSIGNLLFSKTYGAGIVRGVKQTSDSGFVFTGFDGNVLSAAKIDKAGNLDWAKTYGDTNYSNDGYCIVQTSNDNYAIIGSFASTGPYDGDLYLIKADSAGNSHCIFQKSWNILSGNATTIMPSSVVINQQHASVIISRPSRRVSGGSLINTMCYYSVGIEENIKNTPITLFPNPSNGVINIELKNNDPMEMHCYNSTGSLVYSSTISNETKIDLSDLASGLYFVILSGQKTRSTHRIEILH